MIYYFYNLTVAELDAYRPFVTLSVCFLFHYQWDPGSLATIPALFILAAFASPNALEFLRSRLKRFYDTAVAYLNRQLTAASTPDMKEKPE
jgi:hypothetical protein